jgi:hypothetical protein
MKNYLFLIFILALFTNACDKNSQIIVVKKKINYVVTGTANDYLIQYVDEYGNYKQAASSAKWEYEFKARPEKYLYVSARNNTEYGFVKVEVFQNDKLLLTATDNLPFGAAVVSGYVD